MRKHFEVMKWIMTLCLLLFLNGCSEKDAMDVEKPVGEQKASISDTLSMFGSEEEMYAAQTKRLAQKLVCEGQIKDEYDLIFVDACQRDIPYRHAYFRNYAYKDESALDVCYPYELYHVSLSEEGEITYYYTLLDYYVSTLDSGETVIYAGNEQDEVISEVTDLSTALKQESPFKYSYSKLCPLGKIFKSGIDLIRIMEKQWSAEQLAKLQNPVTAAETLLLLHGGKGENLDNGIVKYQFANGEEITYDMSFDGEYWIPMFCWEKDDELYPELKGITDEQERYKMISSLAAKSITMEDIKNAVNNKNTYYDEGMLEEEINEESFGIFDCGDVQLFTDWKKCYLIKDVSVVTQAWYGGHGQTNCFDYDGDGHKEYALVINVMGGTECYMETLYIFDIENDQLDVSEFSFTEDLQEWVKQLLPGYEMGFEVRFKLEGDEILGEFGAYYHADLNLDCSYLKGRIIYHSDGEFGLEEPQIEISDRVQKFIEIEEKVA